MTNELPDFQKPSDLSGGGEWFKLADNAGRLCIFHGFREGTGLNNFGNEYAIGKHVLVLDGDDGTTLYSGRSTEISATALKRMLIESGTEGFTIGRITKSKSEKGGNLYWDLADPTDAEIEAARNTWAKVMEVGAEGWQPIGGAPEEAPF